MENKISKIILEQTEQTPKIILDPQGAISIEGISLPEDPYKTYNPVRDWLTEYIKNPASYTLFEINLPYYNTSSFKYIISLIKILEKIQDNKHKVLIKWHIHDEDEHSILSSIINIPYKLIR